MYSSVVTSSKKNSAPSKPRRRVRERSMSNGSYAWIVNRRSRSATRSLPPPNTRYAGWSRTIRGFYFTTRIDQLPDWLPPVQSPLMAALAAASKSSAKRALRTWGKSADQLPLCSSSRPSTEARQTPFQPVVCLSALHVPRMTVEPLAPVNVHAPLAVSLVEFGAMLQVPLKVRPSAVRALHVETPDSFSLNDSFVSLLTMTSTPRTHPMVPCLVRTMYQISLPTDSAMGKSVSPFSKVAMRSVSISWRAYNGTPVSRAVSTGAASAA